MKKAVFTIQIFVLIALFPTYLVVELNRRTGSIPVNHRPSEFIERPEGNNIKPLLNPENEGSSSLVIRMSAYYFNQ